MILTKEQKSESLRERNARASSRPRSKRHIRRAASSAGSIGARLKRLLRPSAVLLTPFRSAPLRFVGRILSKVFFVGYFRSSWRELRQVEWPGRKETVQLTLAVFAFAVVFAVAISVTDYGLDKIFRKVLIK